MTKVSKEQAKEALMAKAKKVKTEDLEDIVNKADEIKDQFKGSGPLGRFVKDAKLMISIVKDYWNKEYTNVPWGTITAIVAALAYVISPVDLIPDVIPLIGQLDDALVVSACLLFVEQDLAVYEEWKINQASVA